MEDFDKILTFEEALEKLDRGLFYLVLFKIKKLYLSKKVKK